MYTYDHPTYGPVTVGLGLDRLGAYLRVENDIVKPSGRVFTQSDFNGMPRVAERVQYAPVLLAEIVRARAYAATTPIGPRYADSRRIAALRALALASIGNNWPHVAGAYYRISGYPGWRFKVTP